jgi:hypothetical protein
MVGKEESPYQWDCKQKRKGNSWGVPQCTISPSAKIKFKMRGHAPTQEEDARKGLHFPACSLVLWSGITPREVLESQLALGRSRKPQSLPPSTG